MATLEKRLEDQEYILWVKAGICLASVKSGLEEFADERSKRTHGLVKANVGNTNSYYKVCPQANVSFRNGNWTLRCCPECDKYVDELEKWKSPNFKFQNPNWKNTNVQLWPGNAWEMMKVYMNQGQKAFQTKPRDSDLSAILNFIQHCDIPRVDISNQINITKVRDARNATIHSASMKMSPADFKDYTDAMIDLLEDPRFLCHNKDAQDAVGIIKEVKKAAFCITKVDEFQVLKRKTVELEKQNDELHGDIANLKTEYDQKKDEGYTKFVDPLKLETEQRQDAMSELDNEIQTPVTHIKEIPENDRPESDDTFADGEYGEDNDLDVYEMTVERQTVLTRHAETGIPVEILYMGAKAINIYNEALREGTDADHNFSVMVLGHGGVGKTTLTKRLLRLPVNINEYGVTNGVDIHVHRNGIMIATGVWAFTEKKKKKLTHFIRKCFKRKKREKPPEDAPETNYHRRCARALKHRLEKRINEDSTSREDTDSSSSESSSRNDVFKNVASTSIVETTDNLSFSRRSSQRFALRKTQEKEERIEASPDLEPVLMELEHLNKQGTEEKKAYVSFYDFAGQYVFYSSHLTFMSPRAIYLLVMDLQKLSSDLVEEDEFNGDINGPHKRKAMDYLLHWLNVIYSYATTRDEALPQVILVATHEDKIKKRNRAQIAENIFRSIRHLMANTPQIKLLTEKDFVVDNTKKNSPKYEELRSEIFRYAKAQPSWGQLIPTRWLPLEQELNMLKSQGEKVISTEELRKRNRGLSVRIDDKDELNVFLKYLHETGQIIFYSQGALNENIVLDPVWLIEVLRCLITSEKVALRQTDILKEWQYFYLTGTIKRSLIETLWKRSENKSLHKHHTYLIAVLEKLQFIAATPRDLVSEEDKGDEVYIVPCMIRKVPDHKLTLPEKSTGCNSSSVFCLKSREKFLPPATFHKLLAVCISKWKIADQDGNQMIYSGLCRFLLDDTRTLQLTLYLVDYVIHAFVVSFDQSMDEFVDVCYSIRTYLVDSFKKILKSMGLSFCIDECIKCPSVKSTDVRGYMDISLLEQSKSIRCELHKPPHTLNSHDLHDLLACWTEPSKVTETSNVVNTDIPPSIVSKGSMAYCISEDHVNYARVCNALMTVCAGALRKILTLHCPVPYQDIYAAIAAMEATLSGGGRSRGLLNTDQKKLLFPAPPAQFSATVDEFDLSLLYLLIRNVSSVIPPAATNGWGVKPQVSDRSLGANIERFRLLRNLIAGHSSNGEISDTEFKDHWAVMRACLDDIEKEIGSCGFTSAMDMLKDQNMNFLSVKEIGLKFYQEILEYLKEIKKDAKVEGELRCAEFQDVCSRLQEMKSVIEEIKSNMVSKSITFGSPNVNSTRL